MTTQMLDAKALPCPFCGFDAAEETVVDTNEGVAHTPWYAAQCVKCSFLMDGARDFAEALAQWNRRAALPTPAPVIADVATVKKAMGELEGRTVDVWEAEGNAYAKEVVRRDAARAYLLALSSRVPGAATSPEQETDAWLANLDHARKDIVQILEVEYGRHPTDEACIWDRCASRLLEWMAAKGYTHVRVPGARRPHTGGENQCERCLQPNPLCWFVESDIWNRVMRGGDRGAKDRFGFCCPTCFIELAREAGIDPPVWELSVPGAGQTRAGEPVAWMYTDTRELRDDGLHQCVSLRRLPIHPTFTHIKETPLCYAALLPSPTTSAE